MNQNIHTDSNRSEGSFLLMQKLVDGELTHTARSKWLAGLAEDSALWRDLALAFVEQQITDEALKRFPCNESTTAGEGNHASDLANRPSNVSATSSSSIRSSIVMWVCGLASCLLIGVFIGSEFGSSPTNLALVQTNADVKPPEVSAKENEESNVAIELADALSRSGAPVPNEFRRALLRAGYSLKDKRTITNVSLPSGGQIELPVRDVDVTYVGLSSFQ